ncbi:MAG: NAD(P)-dependent oxidoreductase [Desulfurococcaceae archaeon]
MNILITGCAGYIGTSLTPYLLRKGHRVRCIDKLIFGEDLLNHVIGEKNFETFRKDTRSVSRDVLNGVDCVIDMAAIANDPAGELNPELTLSINYKARVRMAAMAKENRVPLYILFSTCSVYGRQEGFVDELSNPNPLTVYAKANLLAEQGALILASNNFTPIALRFATVYGPSKRMRFDLVVNAMTLSAFSEGKIYVQGDGMQERPLIHVLDVSRAVGEALNAAESDKDLLKGQVINIGSDEQNLRVIEIAENVRRTVGGEIVFQGEVDRRSYRVKFEKTRRLLGFKPIYSVEEGIKQIYHELLLGNLRAEPRWITVKWYKQILNENPEVLLKW